jgi:hypothetical protein
MLIIFAMCICCMVFTDAYATTIQAKSCSLTDVRNAINLASIGDSVVVPTGNCKWNSTLTITKAITLQGAGADGCPNSGTCITSTFAANNQGPDASFIVYNPSSSSRGNLFRITGFSFDAAHYLWSTFADGKNVTCHYATQMIHVNGFPDSYIRIDNNRFVNAYRVTLVSSCVSTTPGGAFVNNSSRPFIIGVSHGVMDNNYVHASTGPTYGRGGASIWASSAWNGWNNGTDQNFFIEDNTFVKDYNTSQYQMGAASQAGSIVWRYNDFDFTNHNTTFFYNIDTHGHQGDPVYASFGSEFYGNKTIAKEGQGFNIIDHRGGRAKVFYNKSNTNAGAIRVRTDWGNEAGVNLSTTSLSACPAGSLYAGIKVCAPDGRSQHPEKTYVWNNRKANGTLMNFSNTKGAPSNGNPKLLRENQEWWKDYGTWSESVSYNDIKKTGVYANDIEITYSYTFKTADVFNGSSGIGCGNIERMPSRCNPGVGYWATNQSCSDVPTGMYGRNPTTPIQGTLYICGQNNNWVASYTPYAYPHPLRSGETETISAPKGFKLVN